MGVATSISGSGDITTAGDISSASSSTTGNCTVGGNLLIGTLDVLNSLNLKAPNASPVFTGVVTMADNVLVQASKPGGLNLTSTVKNTAADGYASFSVMATENEVGQIYVGNGFGLNIGSNTAHPIRLCANSYRCIKYN